MKIKFNQDNKPTQDEKESKRAIARRHIAKWQWFLIVLIIISPLLFICYRIVTTQMDKTFDGSVFFDSAGISAPGNCYIKKINGRIGTEVKKGDTIIVFDSESVRVKLKHLKQRLKFLKKRKKFIEYSHALSLKEILAMTNNFLSDTSNFKEKQQALREKGLGTIYNVQGATMEKFTVLMSKLNIFYNKHYYDFEITELGDDILATEEEIANMNQKIAEFAIKSPVDGEIVKQKQYEGEFVHTGAEVLILANKSEPYVQAYMPPDLVDDVTLLQRKVSICFGHNFFKHNTFDGEIVGMPSFTEKYGGVLIPHNVDIVLVIRLFSKIPEKYFIYGYPVKVKLK